MLLILFGLSGVGKNFVGEILEKEFGYYYWDADIEIPENMQAQVISKSIFTQDMRDEFTDIIIKKIVEFKKFYPKIVITQALYKEKNRSQIVSLHCDAKLIQIKASQEITASRIQNRNNWVDYTYAEQISPQFEEPQKCDGIIINDLDEAAVVSQLRNILKLIE